VGGGWWNIALGKPPTIINGAGAQRCGCDEDESVEDRIHGLARVLGIPSKELASAIAGVVVRQQDTPAAMGEAFVFVEE